MNCTCTSCVERDANDRHVIGVRKLAFVRAHAAFVNQPSRGSRVEHAGFFQHPIACDLVNPFQREARVRQPGKRISVRAELVRAPVPKCPRHSRKLMQANRGQAVNEIDELPQFRTSGLNPQN